MTASNKLKTAFSGWGNYPVSSASATRPERMHQLQVNGSGVIARGLGKSYGDASLNEGRHIILMERLNRFLAFDEKTGLLRGEAGLSLEEILEVFVPRGWFLPVTPGTKYVTLGGCLAADVHGKNHHSEGTFSNFVREIEILLADGSKKRCSRESHAELFWATMGGMGLTGIITEASLQLTPIESAYVAVKHRPAQDLEAALRLLEDPAAADRYSVAWIDCLAKGKDFGRSIVMTGHHAKAHELGPGIARPLAFNPAKKFSVPFYLPGWFLNYWSIKGFNYLFYKANTRKEGVYITDYDRYFYPLDSLVNWNRMYGKRGFVQYQTVFPSETSPQGLQMLLEEIVEKRRASFLAVLKRFGQEGLGHLSFPKAGYTLALDIPIDKELFPFLDRLDELVLKYGGRVYLAKDARMRPEIFRAMYPRLGEWEKIKRSIDPKGIFSSDLSRRLKIGGGP